MSVLKPWSARFQFAFRKFFISNLFGNLPKKFEQESKEILYSVLFSHKLEIHRSSLFYTEKGNWFFVIRFPSDIFFFVLFLMVIRIFCIHAYEVLSLSVFIRIICIEYLSRKFLFFSGSPNRWTIIGKSNKFVRAAAGSLDLMADCLERDRLFVHRPGILLS